MSMNLRADSRVQWDPSRQRYIPAIPKLAGLNPDPRAGTGVDHEHAAAYNDIGVSFDAPEEPTSNGAFPYSKLPFELRQMVLRELVPTKSIWNGTSFPKSSPPGRPHDAWGRNEPAVASLLNARLVDRMFCRDIDAFFSHECTYSLMMGATEFFLFKLGMGQFYPSNWHKLLLAWEPGLRSRGPSAYNTVHIITRLATEEMLFYPFLETWDDPVRAAMLRVSPEFNLDPGAEKLLIQPMYGKEGLVDAWQMLNRWALHAWDRITFAKHHESVGFYWSRAFPDTTRFQFSCKLVYSDPLVPGRTYRLDATGQFIGRHDGTPLLAGRDAKEEGAPTPDAGTLLENSH
ncbi:hypothetical protein SLS64_001428 [Diaporthe eres]|uniref:Uncharacterized protein n=1 Tax=Diaporthe eres TaxID=83184 RepID=A0ABR1NRM5_DIAER